MTAKFEEIWEAERAGNSAQAGVHFGTTAAERERARKDLRKSKTHLAVLIDSLELEELRAYAEWRTGRKAGKH